MSTYAYYRDIFKDWAMPLAFVDLNLFDRNIATVIKRADGSNVRVASKSVRCVALLQRVLDADAIFQGLMTFSPVEAVTLSQAGFDDLLMGYPCWHRPHIEAIAGEIRQGKTLVFMVDSVAHIEHLNAIGKAQDVILPVCLDMDMSVDFPGLHFGVWRSGITDVEKTLKVYDAIERASYVRLDGVMGYEAQIAGVGDNVAGSPLKNRMIRLLKRQSIPKIAERRAAIVEALKKRGAELRFVNGGGTGSMESTLAEPAVTEVTVGSGFYAPALFDHYQGFHHHPAAGFAVQIVRQPTKNIYTCLGGGYIASGSVGTEKQPAVYLPEGAKLTALEGAGEVQTPVEYDGTLHIGDPIFMRHSKAGELCERFNHLLLVSDGEIIEEVPTYRGQGWCFL